MVFPNPKIIVTPIKGNLLILYTKNLSKSLSTLLAQANEERKGSVLYYLNRCSLPVEVNYPTIEMHYLFLIFFTQKIRHYMLTHKVNLI